MVSYSKLLLVLLSTSLGIACGQFFQQRFTSGHGGLEGKVVDSEGVATQALITLYYEDPPMSFGRETDLDGGFVVNDLPVGDPLLFAADAFGNLALSRVVVCADELIDIGTLRLKEATDAIYVPQVRGQPLTSGAAVIEAYISRSGKSIVYRVFDEEYPCTHVSDSCKWYLIQETTDGNLKPRGSLEIRNGGMIGLDDQWIYERDATHKLWRTLIDDLETTELGDPSFQVSCAGVSVSGPVCWTDVDSLMADGAMAENLLHWPPDAPQPSILVAGESNGMHASPILSPDGKRVAYAPRNQGEWPGNQRIIIDLTSGVEQVETAENVVILAFDPFGRLASLDIDSQGRIYFRTQPTSKAVMLPTEPIVDLDSLYKYGAGIFFDVYQQVWVATIMHDVENWEYKQYEIKSDTLSVTEIDPCIECNKIWRTNSQGKIAFESLRNGHNKIFTTRFGAKYPVTIVNQNHYLLGWSSDDQSIIYIANELQSGLQQIMSIRIPQAM
jgi:hypothetical protein